MNKCKKDEREREREKYYQIFFVNKTKKYELFVTLIKFQILYFVSRNDNK